MKFINPNLQSKWRAYSLIEISLAVAIILAIASSLAVLLNDTFQFMRRIDENSFFTKDAVQINHLISRVLNKADEIDVYSGNLNANATFSATAGVMTGNILRMTFTNHGDGAPMSCLYIGMIGNPAMPETLRLGVFYRNDASQSVGGTPDWILSRRVDTVTFDRSLGILSIRLTGTGASRPTITFGGKLL
jgi:hypothetical protein